VDNDGIHNRSEEIKINERNKKKGKKWKDLGSQTLA
jgi:hypothetical protein